MSPIVTMSKYGYWCRNIRHAYTAVIMRYTSFRVLWKKMLKIRNDRLIMVNSTYLE